MRWAGIVARIGAKSNTYRSLVAQAEGKGLLGITNPLTGV